MRKFIIKSGVFYFLLLIILSFSIVSKFISGDLGKLGQIPFGKAYDKQFNETNISARYYDLYNVDSIHCFRVITIGDSFSLQGCVGYQQFLGSSLGDCVCNIRRNDFSKPVIDYLALLQNNFFVEGQTVIVEVVERNLVNAFVNVNFDSKCLSNFSRQSVVGDKSCQHLSSPNYFNQAFAFIRLRLGYNNPVYHYKLSSNLFSHPRYADDLYVYDSDLINNQSITDDDISQASKNIEQVWRLSQSKGVNFCLLICPDKYDVYQPFIQRKCGFLSTDGEIWKNDVLDRLVKRDYILCPKSMLQKALKDGVKDLYKVNDTHYSPVGAKLTASYIYQYFINEGVNPS